MSKFGKLLISSQALCLAALLLIASNAYPQQPGNCCTGTNLVANGDFSLGNTQFTTGAYTYKAPTLYNVTDGHYTVCTGAQALIVNPGTWNVNDHFTSIPTSGQFLLVNGNCGIAGPPVSIWSAQPIPINPGTPHTLNFCAYVKSLPASSFPVNPVISVRFNGQSGSGYTFTLPPITVTPTGPNIWTPIQGNITVPTTVNTLNVDILLDQTASGSGNDIAIDNISLLPGMPSSYANFTLASSNLGATSYNLTATYTGGAGSNCTYEWTVGQITNLPGTLPTGANIPASWKFPTNTSTNFKGYINTTTPPINLTPGNFLNSVNYRVFLTVTCAIGGCTMQKTSHYDTTYVPAFAAKPNNVQISAMKTTAPSEMPVQPVKPNPGAKPFPKGPTGAPPREPVDPKKDKGTEK